jgi:hypothetical protein
LKPSLGQRLPSDGRFSSGRGGSGGPAHSDSSSTKHKGGLRALYSTLELPGINQLENAHAALGAAVLAAFGFNAEMDLLAQLLALNQPALRPQNFALVQSAYAYTQR